MLVFWDLNWIKKKQKTKQNKTKKKQKTNTALNIS